MYPLHCAIRKYGSDAFVISELGQADSQDELNRMEIEMIATHQSADRRYGYNVRAGGNSGGKLSAETCKKLSERLTGRAAPNKGKKMSEQQRQEVAERMRSNHPKLGTHCSDETKAKIGAANRVHMLGRKKSEETKQKHSVATIRRFSTPESRTLHGERLTGHFVSDQTRRKIGLAHKGKTISPECRTRIATAVSVLWTDPQFRANQVAKRVGIKPTAEKLAKQSAAMTRVWQARREAKIWQSASAS
jgi:hypothetical protein